MKFDTIIAGGGLSGLVSGIRLAEAGQKCCVVSAGQSAVNFFSGSFDLFNRLAGEEVAKPLESIARLPEKHPYKKVGEENIARLAGEAKGLLTRAGLVVHGHAERNHYVLTPMGTMRSSWLTLDEFTRFEEKTLPCKKAVIVNFAGFLDFHTLFVQQGLSELGVEATIENITMKQLEVVRRNPSEMRSSNIARVFDQGSGITEFAHKVNNLSRDVDVVVLPAVFGLFNPSVTTDLKTKLVKPAIFLPVVPPSTSGMRSQKQLTNRFQALGGTLLQGDLVEKGAFSRDRLFRIHTRNHGDISFVANNFILATGSFYSKGIVASPEMVFEPTFGLDVAAKKDRADWFDEQMFNDQPFMSFGVKTDQYLRASLNGTTIENLYVIGSVLSGANPLKEGSGAGICLISALSVAERILG